MGIVNAFKSYREAFLLGGKHPHDSIYMIQHFLNNNFESELPENFCGRSKHRGNASSGERGWICRIPACEKEAGIWVGTKVKRDCRHFSCWRCCFYFRSFICCFARYMLVRRGISFLSYYEVLLGRPEYLVRFFRSLGCVF